MGQTAQHLHSLVHRLLGNYRKVWHLELAQNEHPCLRNFDYFPEEKSFKNGTCKQQYQQQTTVTLSIMSVLHFVISPKTDTQVSCKHQQQKHAQGGDKGVECQRMG